MTKESWYAGKPNDVVRVYTSDDFDVDYDTRRKMYRVSIFEDYHFKDEFWFDAYNHGRIEEIASTVDIKKEKLNESNW